MFVHKEWARFCSRIDSTLCYRADEAGLVREKVTQFVIMKHDVETTPVRALTMARIESRYGVRGSYYVQADLMTDHNQPIFQQIRELGHEVTYHYDVLDSADGDWTRAARVFAEDIKTFRSYGFSVKTVCPHGNPVKTRKGWSSNKDFFRCERIGLLYDDITDVVVNFRELENFKYIYVSDAGYSWKIIGDVANDDRSHDVRDVAVGGLDAILARIVRGESMIISTHPHRWERSAARARFRRVVFVVVRKGVSVLVEHRGCKALLSRYYHYAKRI